jgi:Skp family chaperone for outer membrane proteins
MKFSRFYLFGFFLASILLMTSQVSLAQKSREIRFGVLNVVTVTQKSLMTKDIARQLSTKLKRFRSEIKGEEDVLRKANDELQKQRVILSPEAFQAEARKFRQRQVELKRKVQQRNQDLNQLRNFTNRKFNTELQRALKDVVKKHGLTLVLKRQEVLVRADFLDITPAVLGALNKNMPKYKIPDNISKTGK